MAEDQAVARLRQIKHVVVVMMENRSFDHMLGYLSLEGGRKDVDGLRGPDVDFNPDPDGRRIPIVAFDADADAVQRHGEALEKRLDPDHSPGGVKTQLGPRRPDGTYPMDGFVRSFVESRDPADNVGEDLWMVPMGHYTAKDLPTYDYLAREYCVCDRWHSSIPGDTWPNRLYSLAAATAESKHEDLLERLAHVFRPIGKAPIFDVAAFTHQLGDEQWRWYSHDPATLRAADGSYRDFRDIKRDNFAYFDRKQVSALTQALEGAVVGGHSFLDDAASGQLPDVSWVDPNFIDLSILDPSSNDDHPPTDIRAGQAFVLELYEALSRSPAWDDTLLVVVYDEHGGFYDHVSPPAVDDGSGFPSYGVRVPALVVGPRVGQQVCHELFDHTTLIKTILTRFAADPDQAIARMPPRVASAQHLGIVLEDAPRQDVESHQAVRDAIDAWRASARLARQPQPGGGASIAGDGAGQPLVLHEFQQEFACFALAMRHKGLPPGQT